MSQRSLAAQSAAPGGNACHVRIIVSSAPRAMTAGIIISPGNRRRPETRLLFVKSHVQHQKIRKRQIMKRQSLIGASIFVPAAITRAVRRARPLLTSAAQLPIGARRRVPGQPSPAAELARPPRAKLLARQRRAASENKRYRPARDIEPRRNRGQYGRAAMLAAKSSRRPSLSSAPLAPQRQ